MTNKQNLSNEFIMSSQKRNTDSKTLKKVLVLELLSWHDECLYSECLLLKENGYSVSLLADLRLKNSQLLLDTVVDEFFYLDFHAGIKTYSSLLSTRKLIIDQNFKYLFVNTAQGNPVWKFFLLGLPRDIQIVGTLHNVSKLGTSFSQKFISRRINKYLLLNEFLLSEYSKYSNKPVSVFYPIFFPSINNRSITKPENEIWIAIPGTIDKRRRDYSVLLSKNFSPNIKFIILGNKNKADGLKFFHSVQKLGISDNFIFFDSFVDDITFQTYIKLADYILPLVHPAIFPLNNYLTTKISGTYNLAFGYKKIMLCDKALSTIEDFVDTSVFYESSSNFSVFVNNLENIQIDKSQFYKLEKWTLKQQTYLFRDLFKSL